MGSPVRFDAVVVGSGIDSMLSEALLAKSGWAPCASVDADVERVVVEDGSARGVVATFIERLHQIGASTFPGPGLSGAPGTIVAKAQLEEHSRVLGAAARALEA